VRSIPLIHHIYSFLQHNILIDDDGVPVLSDIGLDKLDHPPEWNISTTANIRWTAPELMEEDGTTTKQSDVYSFAMTAFEVCEFPCIK
jgi:hypothetical protein